MYDAVTKTDVDRLARRYLSPPWMTVLVVGDRSWIEESLKDLSYGKTVHLLDTAGKPIANPGVSSVAPVETAGRSSVP